MEPRSLVEDRPARLKSGLSALSDRNRPDNLGLDLLVAGTLSGHKSGDLEAEDGWATVTLATAVTAEVRV